MASISRVLFLGSKQVGLRVLQEIFSLSPETLIGVITIDDTNDSRTKLNDFEAYARRNALELHVGKSRKDSERIIEELKPDLCMVVGWYWLISKRAIESVPFGFIGIHNSLLPKCRGGSPVVWSIIKGEPEVGVSFFSITPGVDDGPIWAQESVPVEEDDYISSVLEKLENKTIDILQGMYHQILNGNVEPVDQNHGAATYCAQRFPIDGNINWHESAQDVYNFIRAQSDPYPGAFTYLEGQELKIWRAKTFQNPYFGRPGQVARIDSKGVYVICGNDHAVILEEVELSRKRGKASDIIRSIRSRMSEIIVRSHG